MPSQTAVDIRASAAERRMQRPYQIAAAAREHEEHDRGVVHCGIRLSYSFFCLHAVSVFEREQRWHFGSLRNTRDRVIHCWDRG